MVFGFWKKTAQQQAPKAPTGPPPAPAVPWDENTIAKIIQTDRFDVRITGASHTWGYGSTESGVPIREPHSYEVSGFITYPKFVPVSWSFDLTSREKFIGGWFYHLRRAIRGSKEPDVPILEVYMADPNLEIRGALYRALRDSLTSGRKSAMARLWKNKGDGAWTDKDREHGWSYESRFTLNGLYVFSELEAPRLPPWASVWSDRFSMQNMPAWYDLDDILDSRE